MNLGWYIIWYINRMEIKKVTHLSDNAINEPSEFIIENWVEVNDDSKL